MSGQGILTPMPEGQADPLLSQCTIFLFRNCTDCYMKIRIDSPLFFCEALTADNPVLMLTGEEATHVVNARRLGEGDRIYLTNGSGVLGVGTISTMTRHPISLRVSLTQCQTVPAPETELTLASALPKGDRTRTLLDMSTQLDMQVFQPLDCARSTVRDQPKKHERWRRIIISAAKQCRQVHFPRIEGPRSVRELLSTGPRETLVIYGDPSGDSLYQVTQGILHPPARLMILIGPEGGFDPEEIRLLKTHGAVAVNGGRLILRTETAAVTLLAIAHNWLSGGMTSPQPEEQGD